MSTVNPLNKALSKFNGHVNLERERLKQRWLEVVAMDSPFCDVQIGVRSDSAELILIGGNKSRLMEISPYFRRMWAESKTEDQKDEEDGQVVLDGVSETVLKGIIALSYQQMNEFTIDEHNWADYNRASIKLEMEHLSEYCQSVLDSWIQGGQTGLMKIMFYARQLLGKGLNDEYEELVKRSNLYNYSDVLSSAIHSSDFTKYPLKMVLSMLKSNHLTVGEYTVWQKCVKWCKMNPSPSHSVDVSDSDICVDPMTLIKPHIRFPLMKYEELCILATSPEILTAEELRQHLLAKSQASKAHSRTVSRSSVVCRSYYGRNCGESLKDKFTSSLTTEIHDIWKSINEETDSEFIDVRIQVQREDLGGEEEKVWIGARKSRLREISAFFDAVWNDPIAEDGDCDELVLDGVSETVLRAMVAISFGQFDSVIIDRSTLVEYLYAGLKYDIQLLYDCCLESFNQIAQSADTVDHCQLYFELLSGLHRKGMTDLSTKSFGSCPIFLKSSSDITSLFLSKAVLTLPSDLFGVILKQDRLGLPEMDIWKRCVEWASVQYYNEQSCHIDKPMDDAKLVETEEEEEYESDCLINDRLRSIKQYIRFPLFSYDELAEFSGYESVISPKEMVHLYHAKSGKIPVNPKWNAKHRADKDPCEQVKNMKIGSHVWYRALDRFGSPSIEYKAIVNGKMIGRGQDTLYVEYQPRSSRLKTTTSVQIKEKNICNCNHPCTNQSHRIRLIRDGL